MPRVLLLFLIGINAMPGWAQDLAPYQPQKMHADLDKFSRALVDVHPGAFTHQGKEEFEESIHRLKLETSSPLEPIDFYRVVLRWVASVHDGHTQAYPLGKLGRAINNQKRLPFQVYATGERLFIVKDMSSQGIPEGSEIVTLDGHLSNAIISRILSHYSSDGMSRTGMLHWLAGPYRPFYRLYPEIFGAKPNHELVYRDYRTQELVTTRVGAISEETYDSLESERYPAPKKENEAFYFELDEQKRIAYLKIHRFLQDSYDEPESIFVDFYRKCFEEIHDKNVKNLVVDLRDNGGGKASNAAYLLQYLTEKTVTPATQITTNGNDAYFSRKVGASLNLDSSFGLQPMSDGRFRVTRSDVLRDLKSYPPIGNFGYSGKLIVLINGGTASAAGIAAGLLRAYTQAIFVGEETFGYAGISNGVRQVSIKGDHTEVAISMPLLHAEYSVHDQAQRRGVVPDRTVSRTIHDVLARRDVALDLAFGELLSAEKGGEPESR